MWYQIALFVHITGAIALFISLGLEWLGINRLRKAERVEQVRETSALLRVLGTLFPISTVLLLGGGLYMAITVWGFALAWLDAALVGVIAMTVLGNVVSARRLGTIGQTAFLEPDGPLSTRLRALTTDPVLVFWSQLSILLGWWIVFLMTLKPALPGTLVSFVVAVTMAGAIAQASQRALRTRSADEVQTRDRREVTLPNRQ
jgi:uncharacterized membrane protein SirB2